MNTIGDFLDVIELAKKKSVRQSKNDIFQWNHDKPFTEPFSNIGISAPTWKKMSFLLLFCS